MSVSSACVFQAMHSFRSNEMWPGFAVTHASQMIAEQVHELRLLGPIYGGARESFWFVAALKRIFDKMKTF